LSCFQEIYIAPSFIFTCNFLLQFLSSIAQNIKAFLNKNNAKLFQFISILFHCMKKSYMTD